MRKIGDKVKIKSLEWYNLNSFDGNILVRNSMYVFAQGMTKYCGKEFIITSIQKDIDMNYTEPVYQLRDATYFWHKWMFEPTKQQLEFDFIV